MPINSNSWSLVGVFLLVHTHRSSFSFLPSFLYSVMAITFEKKCVFMCVFVCIPWNLVWKFLSPGLNFVCFCQVPSNTANKGLFKPNSCSLPRYGLQILLRLWVWIQLLQNVVYFNSSTPWSSPLTFFFCVWYCVLLCTKVTFIGLPSGW